MPLSLQRIGLIALIVVAFFGFAAVQLYGQSSESDNTTLTVSEPPQISSGALAGHEQGATDLPSAPSLDATQNDLMPEPDTAVNLSFKAFAFDDNATENAGSLFIPPDPQGAAGMDRLVAIGNTMIEARNKSGVLLWRDALHDFFLPLGAASLGTRTYDPKIIFDPYENRFVVVALERTDTATGAASNESRILLAVSKNASPATTTASDWYYMAINSKTTIGLVDTWADYPGFEADEEAIYVTSNMYTFGASGTFQGVRLWIIPKDVAGGFYGGNPGTFTVFDPYAAGGIATTTMPAQVMGAGGAGSTIGTFLVSYSGLSGGGIESVQIIRVDNPLAATTFTQQYISVGDIEDSAAAFPDAPQSGSATLIETNDRRALDAAWRNNQLWFVATILPVSGADANQTTAHWWRLNTSALPAGAITLADQGNIGGNDIAANTFTFFPSLAVNNAGDVCFGFSASAATIYAGAYVAARSANDAAGTVQGSVVVKAGEDFYIRTFGGPRNRWGDYSGMSLDPTDETVFWAFNEYADVRGTLLNGEEGRWSTAWGRCQTGSGTPTFPRGDINGDNSVNIIDLQALINMILHFPQPDTALAPLAWWQRADLDQNSNWNVIDLQTLINLILGIGV